MTPPSTSTGPLQEGWESYPASAAVGDCLYCSLRRPGGAGGTNGTLFCLELERSSSSGIREIVGVSTVHACDMGGSNYNKNKKYAVGIIIMLA